MHTAPSPRERPLGNTTPTNGQQDPILVRAARVPGIGVNSLGGGFARPSKGSRVKVERLRN